MKQIFVGGYGGTGSRVFQDILAKAGYYQGYHNEYYDWLMEHGPYVPYIATAAYHDNNIAELTELIDETVASHSSWSLKHGHLMFLFGQLKLMYPESVCVLTVRHPLDTVTNGYMMHASHGKLPLDAPVGDRLDFYGAAHDVALKYTDFVFRLEDAVFDTDNTVKKILEFADVPVPDDLEPYTKDIIVPKTIGRGKQYYNQFKDHPILERLDYV